MWPTVRQAARSLGWTQQRIEDACDGDPDYLLSLSSYLTVPEPPLGDHFIESIGTPDVVPSRLTNARLVHTEEG
jgi:hypothetical protein